jgi:hypothetical protein
VLDGSIDSTDEMLAAFVDPRIELAGWDLAMRHGEGTLGA